MVFEHVPALRHCRASVVVSTHIWPPRLKLQILPGAFWLSARAKFVSPCFCFSMSTYPRMAFSLQQHHVSVCKPMRAYGPTQGLRPRARSGVLRYIQDEHRPPAVLVVHFHAHVRCRTAANTWRGALATCLSVQTCPSDQQGQDRQLRRPRAAAPPMDRAHPHQ